MTNKLMQHKRLKHSGIAVLTALCLPLTWGSSVQAESEGKSLAQKLEQTAAGKQEFWKSPLIPVSKDFRLSNGLRVMISEDHSVPVVALAIVYDVGARNEVKKRSGFAHLFEHMMFEGSENVAKTEHFKYVEAAGGLLNASTHEDFTNYFEKLPSNQIELALWLESDRMRSLKVTPENFENQLQAVKEEKRAHFDNQPYVPAAIKLEETLFDNWINSHPVIGYFEDLEASSIDDVKQFFRTYYAPNNATMAIVGDVDPAQMERLVSRYFGSIPAQPTPPKPDVTEPLQTKAKYIKVEDQYAEKPAFWLSWKAPARRDSDYYALGIIEKLLSTGDSSRLYQRMVKGDQIALKVEASYEERRGPSAFETFVIYKPATTAEEARKVLWSEIEKLKTDTVSQDELVKAQNQILRSLFASGSELSLQRSLARAELLAEYGCFYGDPSLIDKDVAAYLSVTPDDVKRVASKIFTQDGATVLDVVPAPKKETSDSQSESNNHG
jgi:zinc protease